MRSKSISLDTPRRKLRWLARHWNLRRAQRDDAEAQLVRLPALGSRELLDAILGIQISPELQSQASLYYSFLIKSVHQIPPSLNDALSTTTAPERDISRLQLETMKNISSLLLSATSTTFVDLVDGLTANGLLAIPAADEEGANSAAVSLVVTLLGRMTMLYPATQEILSIVSTSGAGGPIAEFLRDIDSLMPIMPYEDSTLARGVELQVSNMNAQTLTEIGDITLVWTTQMGDHLKFNHSTQELHLFCLPSFSQLHIPLQSDQPTRPLITRVLDGHYWTGPYRTPSDTFDMASFSQQLCSTYRPLFANSKRARAIYLKSERHKVQQVLGGIVDPALDDLCLAPLEAYPVKQSYDATRDFPYFAERLQDLQTYILCQSPNRVKLLWKDRRDVLRWYTFWAVIIIGGIGIVLAVAQTVLSALQVAAAFKDR